MRFLRLTSARKPKTALDFFVSLSEKFNWTPGLVVGLEQPIQLQIYPCTNLANQKVFVIFAEGNWREGVVEANEARRDGEGDAAVQKVSPGCSQGSPDRRRASDDAGCVAEILVRH